MRDFIRTAAVVALLAPVLGLGIPKPEAPAPQFRGIVPEQVRERGELRLAVRAGTLAYFVHEGRAFGFEYELLSRFANRLDVDLAIERVDSAHAAERLIRDGLADVAVLPPERTSRQGVLPLRPYPLDDERPAWAPTGALFVHRHSKSLWHAIDQSVEDEFSTGHGRKIYRRYFPDPRRLDRPRPGQSLEPGRISAWDKVIARHAAREGYDWRLIAALIFQESSFDPKAVSPKGAVGLMQLMPSVAVETGIRDLSTPDSNVRAGLRYLSWLSTWFPESLGEDRVALVLASYLMGPGHMRDAQDLARSIGLDPHRFWGSVEQVLPLLEHEHFHRSTRYGFARGSEAVEYVHRIFRLHNFFRSRVGPKPGLTRPESSDGRSA